MGRTYGCVPCKSAAWRYPPLELHSPGGRVLLGHRLRGTESAASAELQVKVRTWARFKRGRGRIRQMPDPEFFSKLHLTILEAEGILFNVLIFCRFCLSEIRAIA